MPKAAGAKTKSVHKQIRWPKWLSLIILGIILIGLSLFLTRAKTCRENYKQDTKINVGGSTIYAQNAQSPRELKNGLAGRSCISSNQGMLFIFNKPGYYPFWMKGMKFSIDMVWISSAKQVVHIEKDVSPSTYPKSFVSAQPAQYVLELQARRVDSLRLRPGSHLYY